MRSLTIVAPGLLGPDVHFSDDFIPQLPALETLLSRSRHTQVRRREYHRTLAGLMGFEIEPDKDVPVAAVTRIVDNNHDASGTWLRADPVHLSPDRNGLILMDSFILNLSQHDALAIAAEVSKVIAEYGWKIEVPFEDRWYIRIDEELDLTTSELSSAVGFDIVGYLPRGRDAARLNKLLNEIQIHLHAADINQFREKNGELPVNSVWFWGMGSLDEIPEPAWSAIFTNDVFASSLAELTDTACFHVPQHFLGIQENSGGEGDVLVVLPQCQAPSQYQNLELWHKALLLLEGSWFEPVLEWLQQGKLKKLRIISDTHEFQLNRFGLKKFWRKPVAIGHYRKQA
jgi:hypothetical protein